MFDKIKTLTHHSTLLLKPKKTTSVIYTPQRTMCWLTGTRLGEKGNFVPPYKLPICLETGFKICPVKDSSGQSHPLLIRKINGKNFVYGAFSSSEKNINGEDAILVSTTNLNGVEKKQYFHPYPEPRVLDESAISWTTYPIIKTDANYINFLVYLKKKYNLS